MSFSIDLSILKVTAPLAPLTLCDARLMRDARFLWIILVPRREGAIEIDDLDADDRAALYDDMIQAAAAVRAIGKALGRPVDKMNIAALGNVTPQLHIHVVGRRRDDDAWPRPVWGVGEAVPYSDDEVETIRRLWTDNG